MLSPSRETRPFHHRPLTTLATLHHTQLGTVTLFHLHQTLVTHTTDTGFTDVAILPAEPLCAIPLSDAFLIMTSQGPVRLILTPEGWDIDSTTSVGNATGTFPAITVTAHTAGTLTASTQPLDITDIDFSRNDPSLPDAATTAITRRLTDTYSALSLQAVLGNLWLQPVMLRYRIISHTGVTLHTSAPMVLAPDGWQCCNLLSVTCSRSGSTLSVPAIPVSAQAFSLKIHIDTTAAWHPDAAAVEFLVSPQLHPVDLDADAPCRLQRTATTTPVLTVAMPGTTASMASLDWQRTDRLRETLARIDLIPATSTRFSIPLTDAVTPLPNTSALTVDRELRLLRSTLAQPVAVTPNKGTAALLRDISTPHSFYARTALTAADTVIWGDITPIPSLGYPLSDLAASFSPGAWHGVLRIHMQSGQTIAGALSADDRMPASLAPVITYPHPQASMLELFVCPDTSPSTVLRAAVPLSPSPSGAHALFIHQSLAPTPLTATELPMPEITNADTSPRHPGMLAAAAISAPLSPLAAIQCSSAPILALTPAVRSASSWDFSRCRFYAFSRAGIYAVALNAARSSLAATLIDPRGIERAHAAVHTPLGVMALSGSELISVTAARTATVTVSTDAVELAWDSPSQSLWLIDALGNLSSRHIPSGYLHSILSPESVNAIQSTGTALYLTTPDSLLIPAEPYSSERPIRYIRTIPMPFPSRPQMLELRISASAFEGSIAIRAHSIPSSGTSGESYPVTTLRISGAINAPLRIPVLAPPRPYISLIIEAYASPDFILSSILLNGRPTPLLPPSAPSRIRSLLPIP